MSKGLSLRKILFILHLYRCFVQGILSEENYGWGIMFWAVYKFDTYQKSASEGIFWQNS